MFWNISIFKRESNRSSSSVVKQPRQGLVHEKKTRAPSAAPTAAVTAAPSSKAATRAPSAAPTAAVTAAPSSKAAKTPEQEQQEPEPEPEQQEPEPEQQEPEPEQPEPEPELVQPYMSPNDVFQANLAEWHKGDKLVPMSLADMRKANEQELEGMLAGLNRNEANAEANKKRYDREVRL